MAKNMIIVAGLEEKGIYFSNVPADGLPPALDIMNFIGEIVPDSVTSENDEDTYNEIIGQETQNVLTTLLAEKGVKRKKFSTYNFNDENLKLALGGTVEADGTWNEATSGVYKGVLKCIAFMSRATAETGLHELVYYIKVLLRGADEGLRQEGDANKLNFIATKQSPANALGENTPAVVIKNVPTAPTNGIVDDTANTFAWDDVPVITGFIKYEYSKDGGSSWSDCTTNPQIGITGAIPAGDVQVRVKKNTSVKPYHTAGLVLVSKEPYTP